MIEELIDQNIQTLQQGIEVLENLTQAQYATAATGAANASDGIVGTHVRHCVDLYTCLLTGLAEGKVAYDERARQSALEHDQDEGLSALREVIKRLEKLRNATLPEHLHIRLETQQGGWAHTSLERELQFLVGHLVHHYALIAQRLKAEGHPVPDHFGVARSTLQYRMGR